MRSLVHWLLGPFLPSTTATEPDAIPVEHPRLTLTHEWKRTNRLFGEQSLFRLEDGRKVGEVWCDSGGVVHAEANDSGMGKFASYELARCAVERYLAERTR